ncbi:hypothetical protein EDC01DRAFT_416780 [Geopyxis carbonaria]|nr:hypothetical protein EDC01DRAFT_416780 [Geopyxis carbonaria]
MRTRQRSHLPYPELPASESSSSSSPERMMDEDDDDDDQDMMPIDEDSQTSIGQLTCFRNMTVSPTGPTWRSQHPKSPVYLLPPELLMAIFGKLSSPVDLSRCMLVSKQWASCSVELLWHRPYFAEFKKYQAMVAALLSESSFFAYPQLIRRLNLNFISDKVNDGSMKPLTRCTRLERLTLTNCSRLTDSPLMEILRCNPRIQALDLSQLENITDLSMRVVAEHCPRLQGLNIAGCKNVTDLSMIPLSENRRMLRRLKLNDCNQLTDASVLALAENCPQLLEIDLHRCHQITDESVIHLFSNLKHLRELRLAYCELLTDGAFLQLPPNKTYETLRILDLTDCGLLTDDAVEKIVKMAPRLRNLILAKCRHITDRAVHSITKLGKNLHNLHLGHCSHITDRAVRALVQSCTRLRYIDLACCLRLTDASVCQLAQLPKLRRIGLVKCNNITDFAIQSLVRRTNTYPCPLERVHLSYCMHLTVEGVHDLINHCQRLTHLSLTGVEAFYRQKEFTQFCRSPPKEFNENQRAVFCVFSGHGVKQLRQFLNNMKAREEENRDTSGGAVVDNSWELDTGTGDNALATMMDEEGSNDEGE